MDEVRMSLVVMLLFVSGLVLVVECLNCKHAELPTDTTDAVELTIDCSYIHPIIAYSNNVPNDIFWGTYTILYTCRIPNGTIVKGTAINGSLQNILTKNLTDIIPCGSLCTFGGCYSSLQNVDIINLSISPIQSCSVCHETDNSLCAPRKACVSSESSCTPSLHLGNGSLSCNCTQEDCENYTTTTSDVYTFTEPDVERCICNCTEIAEPVKKLYCNCSNGLLDEDNNMHCTNINYECELKTIGVDSVNMDSSLSPLSCVCKENYCPISSECHPGMFSCKPIKSMPPYFLVNILTIIFVPLILGVSVAMFVVLYLKRKKKSYRSAAIDAIRSDEICSLDPVEVESPKHQINPSESCMSFFDSFQIHPSKNTDNFNVESLPTSNGESSRSLIILSDSGYQITDIEWYNTYCICSLSNLTPTEVCLYCHGVENTHH